MFEHATPTDKSKNHISSFQNNYSSNKKNISGMIEIKFKITHWNFFQNVKIIIPGDVVIEAALVIPGLTSIAIAARDRVSVAFAWES